MPVELLGKSAEELRQLLVSLGELAYRGPQIYRALYTERRFDFAAMTNLPAALRSRLAKEARITLPRLVRPFPSVDGSIRYLFSIGAEETKPARIESVFMPKEGRQTICISTQAGCAVDCHFCLTAQLGLIRNLTAGEIVGQVLVALEENREELAPQIQRRFGSGRFRSDGSQSSGGNPIPQKRGEDCSKRIPTCAFPSSTD